MDALAKCFLEKMKVTGALLTAFLLFMGVLCWTASPALAVDGLGLLELEEDANITEQDHPTAPGDDWLELFSDSSSTVAYTFIEDGTVKFNGVDRIFTKSKDIEDIPDWEHKADFNTPPKDNIFNGHGGGLSLPRRRN